ncbi:AbrB/MazE/SpoVT family DNA-binding domain-containing protein [Candidatus Dependentiae bacterium]|nr:AbrB/MazE/SpoVT family DNA-binding domain-containing protein [Candidatus Dependentiae bacterium]
MLNQRYLFVSKSLMLVICLALQSTVASMNNVESVLTDQDVKDPQVKYNLPINCLLPERDRCNLTVTIPKEFRLLQEGALIEFIPKDDKNEDDWSRIITLQPLRGKKASAYIITSDLKNLVSKIAKEVMVLEHTNQDLKAYKKSTLLISYTLNNKREILFAQYFSGPSDCAGCQYTVRLDNSLNNLLQLAGCIQEFITTNIRITKF